MIFGTYRAGSRDAPESMRLGLDELRGAQANHLTWLLASVLRSNLGGTAALRAPSRAA